MTVAAEVDWTIFPGKGIGKLEFGMSATQVDALSHTYGAVTGRMNDQISDEILRGSLEKFGGAMTDEEKQSLIAACAESGPSADSVTETRGDPGLVLGYQADRLAEIMSAEGQRPLFLEGKDIFSLSGLELLTLLERLNGGPGRYASTEAAFDNLAISVAGFCVTDRAAGVQMLDKADERFQGRTVMLRSEPYRPEDGIDSFVTHSVLG
ncbi:MAG: hypothetical protein WBB07_24410 [Mycobacterium sp.]